MTNQEIKDLIEVLEHIETRGESTKLMAQALVFLANKLKESE